jgi:predicted DNA-binding antitoxin AbrB/MazE fold protein
LEQISYQYQLLLDDSFKLKDKVKLQEQEIQNLKIQVISAFNSTQKTEEMQNLLEKARKELEEAKFIHG